MINAEEREEMLRLSSSSSLKEDMRFLGTHRHNPLIIAKQVSMDRLLEFLNGFNEFINHEPRPFRKIVDKNMKL